MKREHSNEKKEEQSNREQQQQQQNNKKNYRKRKYSGKWRQKQKMNKIYHPHFKEVLSKLKEMQERRKSIEKQEKKGKNKEEAIKKIREEIEKRINEEKKEEKMEKLMTIKPITKYSKYLEYDRKKNKELGIKREEENKTKEKIKQRRRRRISMEKYLINDQQEQGEEEEEEESINMKMTLQLKWIYEDIKEKHEQEEKMEEKNKGKPLVEQENSGEYNNGMDNEQGHYMVRVGEIINKKYKVIDKLGEGTFGIVVLCEDILERKKVALKIIKNIPIYKNQARKELYFMNILNNYQNNKMHVVQYKEHFEFKNHLIIVTEALGINLFELCEKRHYQGMTLRSTRKICTDLLSTLKEIRKLNIIHCDIKPENIVLMKEYKRGDPFIKLIDFGTACHEGNQELSYIQSRHYRAPEILLKYPTAQGIAYGAAIDMWSFACVAVELFIGIPLFPGQSQHNQVLRIVETIGHPESVFTRIPPQLQQEHFYYRNNRVQVKSTKAYAIEKGQQELKIKRYLRYTNLRDIIMTSKKNGNRAQCEAFVDFIIRILQWDPIKRLTPEQALEHPFITNPDMKFFDRNGWKPPPEKQNMQMSISSSFTYSPHMARFTPMGFGNSPVSNNFSISPHISFSPSTGIIPNSSGHYFHSPMGYNSFQNNSFQGFYYQQVQPAKKPPTNHQNIPDEDDNMFVFDEDSQDEFNATTTTQLPTTNNYANLENEVKHQQYQQYYLSHLNYQEQSTPPNASFFNSPTFQNNAAK